MCDRWNQRSTRGNYCRVFLEGLPRRGNGFAESVLRRGDGFVESLHRWGDGFVESVHRRGNGFLESLPSFGRCSSVCLAPVHYRFSLVTNLNGEILQTLPTSSVCSPERTAAAR